jgi:hypothetical protein
MPGTLLNIENLNRKTELLLARNSGRKERPGTATIKMLAQKMVM